MTQLRPEFYATPLQPGVEGIQVFKHGRDLPQPMPGVLNVLLDLAFFPTRCWVAELSLEDEVIDHDLEAHVHVPSLPLFDLVDSRFHVVEDAPLRYATKHPECMVMRVEDAFRVFAVGRPATEMPGCVPT